MSIPDNGQVAEAPLGMEVSILLSNTGHSTHPKAPGKRKRSVSPPDRYVKPRYDDHSQ